jgi:hypothetical protein
MRVHDQDESNCDFSLHDIILEEKSIGLHKKSLKESSWLGEPKCKLKSKVAYFFGFFFTLVAQIW